MRNIVTKLALGALVIAAPIAAFAGPVPGTCDILQNIYCDDPVGMIRAILENLFR